MRHDLGHRLVHLFKEVPRHPHPVAMHRDHAVRIPVLRAPAVAGMMTPGEEKRARQRAEAVAVVQRAQELEGAEVHPDQTYKIALAAVFITIEANAIIICNSLPYLRQFLRYYAPRWVGDNLSSRRKSSVESPVPIRKPGLSQLQDDVERAITHTEGTASLDGNTEQGPKKVV
ncbi:hypothetical protein ETB97_008316 [Aspergillus alliaceus]|uniref:Uncharacterized protein n=1 Tax=Petromyces alliaceus TaxID=209559 RepID=A0A8H5ZV57_PETAA|nr:hypothetical protein ETB97_008316 [Aspergillus burnettii]